ncbi:MAG: Mur ligase family protein [Arhodomonas sp.]|nr:Mur ligase family protein [Arhodomonas sp.]
MAVLTNLSRDHLDYHGSEAAYARREGPAVHRATPELLGAQSR